MDQVEIGQACRHDAADIADLARKQLPEMTYLHDAEGWTKHARFGAGRHPRDKFALVARLTDTGELIGFFWVDDAPATDFGIAEPWWCINALAVRSDLQRKGLGRSLVGIIVQQATEFGVHLLYGLCYPVAAPFWEKQGFIVGAKDQDMIVDRPVQMLDGSQARVSSWDCEPGNHFFLRHLRVHDSARLEF